MKNNLPNLALAILRIGASAMLLTHGIPKIQMLFADTISFPDPLGVGVSISLTLAVIGEAIAPLFILVGFRTKLASVIAMITMLVAGLIHHSNDPFATKEKAFLFALIFLVVFLAGPGKYSIDKR